ncbi:hypothetical protein AAFC00_000661 [Neodothiora populina]|uniref:Major facilitator superfamily (MFS) profile domain-containing protein n=1 Tax=Neodothiora populina TaxID=2781224 RepID=A0ABR3PDM8_9PEZI
MPSRLWKRLAVTLHLSTDYSEKPAGLKWRSSTFFIVATVAIGLFADMFMYGLIVPILPFMLEDRVHLPKDQVQSAVAGLLASYAGASVLFCPIAGFVADKTSTRQLPFLLGLTALLGATFLLFIGTDLPVLFIARILQGISAAVVWTIGLALCVETVGPQNLGTTIGSIFSFTSVGNLSAPLLGGILYEKVSYAGVFILAFAILAVDFLMRLLVIEKKTAQRYYDEDSDDTSSDTNTTSSSNIDNDHEGNNDGGSNNEEQPLLGNSEDLSRYKFTTTPSALAHKIPILPCLKDPGLLTAFVLVFVYAILLGSFDATVPTVAQEYFGFDSMKAGLLFLPLGIFDLLLGPLAGWAVDRLGTKSVSVAGYAYLVPVLVLLRLPHAGGNPQIILYNCLLALCGVGLAIIGAPSYVEAGTIVQKYFDANPEFFGEGGGPYAQLYGLSNMVFSAGLAVGPELASELKQAIGYGNANLVLAIICFVTAVMSFFFIGDRPKFLRRA